jgi:hypothetical protein
LGRGIHWTVAQAFPLNLVVFFVCFLVDIFVLIFRFRTLAKVSRLDYECIKPEIYWPYTCIRWNPDVLLVGHLLGTSPARTTSEYLELFDRVRKDGISFGVWKRVHKTLMMSKSFLYYNYFAQFNLGGLFGIMYIPKCPQICIN